MLSANLILHPQRDYGLLELGQRSCQLPGVDRLHQSASQIIERGIAVVWRMDRRAMLSNPGGCDH